MSKKDADGPYDKDAYEMDRRLGDGPDFPSEKERARRRKLDDETRVRSMHFQAETHGEEDPVDPVKRSNK